jgi:4-azaleucine resistance transporter AzlC
MTTLPAEEQHRQARFTLSGVWLGARRCLPVAVSVFAYGLVFGVLARQSGLSLWEVLLMSAFVYSGTVQLLVLSLWTYPLPVGAILFTTLIVSLRNLLMGTALSPWLSQIQRWKAAVALFFLADENWALTMDEFAHGGNDAAFLLGSGLALYVAWLSSTLLGRLVSGVVPDPARFGLDFAFTAVFLALLVGLWKGKSDLLPWIVAAAVSLITAHLLPDKWYILCGALAGSLVGVVRDAR